jgi:hypothetical protein
VLDAANHSVVTLQCDYRDTLKANGQHLKLLLELEPMDLEEVDLLDFLELE